MPKAKKNEVVVDTKMDLENLDPNKKKIKKS